MGNMMLILKKKSKGDMRNSRKVTLTPPLCMSEETILENTRNNIGINWSNWRRINSFCKGKSWLSHLVTFWRESGSRQKRDNCCSPLGCPKIFQSLSAKPLKETVLPCDKRKGPTWLNIQLNNGMAKNDRFYQGKEKTL